MTMFAMLAGEHQADSADTPVLFELVRTELRYRRRTPTPRLPLVSLAKLGLDRVNNEVLLVLL
jgi:hypothetical protein